MSGIISPICSAMKRLCSKPSSRKETAAPAGPPIVRSTTLQVRRTPRRGKASKCVPWHFSNDHAFDIDIENCPNCGGALKIIAAIEDPPVIIKIVSHLGLPTHAPPRFPARPVDFIPDNLTAENCLPTKPTMPFALTWTERRDNATLRARPVRFRPSRPVQERVFHPSQKDLTPLPVLRYSSWP